MAPKKKIGSVKVSNQIPKSSAFDIMISSNQTDNSLRRKHIDIETFKKDFISVSTKALNSKDCYVFRIEDGLGPDDILEIKLDEIGIEYGPERHHIHCHAVSVVRYKNVGGGYVHVDFKKLRDALLSKLPLTEIKLNVQFIKQIFAQASNHAVKDKFKNGGELGLGDGSEEEQQPTKPKRRRRRPTDGEPKKRGRPRKVKKTEYGTRELTL